jgi:hypothetical protein
LFDAMSLSILPRPNTGQQSPITTGPLRRAHLTGDEVVLFVVPQLEKPLWDAAIYADYIEGRIHDDRRHLLTSVAGTLCLAEDMPASNRGPGPRSAQ